MKQGTAAAWMLICNAIHGSMLAIAGVGMLSKPLLASLIIGASVAAGGFSFWFGYATAAALRAITPAAGGGAVTQTKGETE